jgi:CDP-diacylglycerol--glycerol-3-phosphate 3-phosphatidyltransferase
MSSSFGVSISGGHRRTVSTRKPSSSATLAGLDRRLVMMRGGGIEDGSSEEVDINALAATDNGTHETAASTIDATPAFTAPPHAAAAAEATSIDDIETSSSQPSSSSNQIDASNYKLGPNAPPPGYIRRLLPTFPWHELPNYLTYARCLSIPLFLGHAYYPSICRTRAPNLGCIFALASITDWFDGYLARRWDVTSAFGAFLDPVADKLMVSTALLILSGRYGGIVAIPSAIILARELGVSALREWMASRGKRGNVKVGMQGKVKAALTMVSLTCMLLVPEGVGLECVGWTKYFGLLGVGGMGNVARGGEAVIKNAGLAWMLGPSLLMLFASAIITVTSGSVYFRAALPVLLGKE